MVRYCLLLTLLNLSTAAIGQADLEKGLVACYSFSGNANDGSGNNYHGNVKGPVLTSDRFGKPASAYLFDGRDDYIVIPAAPFRVANYTYAMWINVSVLPVENTGGIISIGNQRTEFQGVEVNNNDNYPDGNAFAINFSGSMTESSMIMSVMYAKTTQRWYHVAAERTSTHINTYLDGILQLSTPINLDGSPSPIYYEDPLTALIGMRSMFLYPFFGIIDDMVIYDRALSDEEIYKLYAEGIPCSSSPLISLPVVNNATQCGEGTAVLTASGGTQYRWYNKETGGDLLFEGNPFIIPNISETSSYYVSNVDSNLESRRREVTVTVHPLPELKCDFPDTVFTVDPVIYRVETISGTSPFNYHFNFGDGSTLITENNTTQHAYHNAGSYHTFVTATDAAGCEANCSSTIESITEEFFIPNVITPNSDLHNEVFTLYLKIDDNYLLFPQDKKFDMRIYNRWGVEIFRTADAAAGWNGNNVATGVYYYTIEAGDNNFKGVLTVLK